jgi:hypothetical protein
MCDGARSWQLAVGSWQLAVGSWQLAVGSWQLAVGSWQLGRMQTQRVYLLSLRRFCETNPFVKSANQKFAWFMELCDLHIQEVCARMKRDALITDTVSRGEAGIPKSHFFDEAGKLLNVPTTDACD